MPRIGAAARQARETQGVEGTARDPGGGRIWEEGSEKNKGVSPMTSGTMYKMGAINIFQLGEAAVK